jgi:hypothetical protein
MRAWQPGDQATWLHEPRGGYGYVIPVNAVVVRVGPKRVLIEVARVNGDLVQRWVTPDRLRERSR